MRPDLEDYDELNMGDGSARARAMSWLVLLVAIGGFTSLAYYAYKSGSKAMRNEAITVVEAEQTPIKTVPEDPQGEKFPNKDKTIYDAIEQGNKTKPAEKLMPEAERPMLPESAKEEGDSETDTGKAAATTYVNNATKPAPAPVAAPAPHISLNPTPQKPAPVEKTPAQPEIINVKPVTVASKPTSEEKDAKAKPEVKPTPTPEKPAASAAVKTGGAYKIQLGAYQSESEAAAMWKRISAKHADVVSGAPIIVKADTAKGTFYRLRASGFASMDAAKAACAKLSARGQACFAVGK